jgi:hypothetical protein
MDAAGLEDEPMNALPQRFKPAPRYFEKRDQVKP